MKSFTSVTAIAVLFIIFFVSNVLGGEILFLLAISTKSHKLFLKPFIEALESRGHNITMTVNIDKPLLPNVTELSYSVNGNFFSELNEMCFNTNQNKPIRMYRSIKQKFDTELCCQFLRGGHLERLLQEGKKYDIVFTSAFFEECALPIATSFSKNVIFLQFMRLFPPFSYELDVPQPYSYVPFPFLKFKTRMGFIERFWNAIVSFYFAIFFHDLSIMDKLVAEKFPQAPRLEDAHSKISMVFTTSDPVLYNALPSMPHVVSIGGLHCRQTTPLPNDLESIMANSGEYGVIYFSMGTVVDIRMASKDLPEIFLNVFSRLNQTILWKAPFELENIPHNVKLIKWAPQQDVLGHPKLRLYITQGGIFSLHEAIYHGVPILGLPVFTDQFSNVVRMEELGLGLHLDTFKLTPEDVYSAIFQILNDPGYSERSKKYSIIFKDQAETPMERAVYWTEFLMNHSEASLHFRTFSHELNLFQYHSLDIIASVIAILMLILWITVKLLKYFFGYSKQKHL